MATYLSLPDGLPSHKDGFKPDTGVEHQTHAIAQHWLTQFEVAATSNDADLFAGLFVKNGFWRDIIAFTNDYRSIRTNNIAEAAKASLLSTILFISCRSLLMIVSTRRAL